MTTSSPLPPAHLRRALLATLALLALGIGVAPGQAVAASGPAGTSEADTITTVLYPGWNLVGWVGPGTPTSELFDAIPALRQVSAWDAEAQAYRHALRRRYSDLPTLTPGVGLWLRLGGDSTVEWTRDVSGEGVVISLRAGRNLVGWTGADGTPVADALARFGDEPVEALRWEAETQRYVHYRPDTGDVGFTTLARGQALRLELSRDARWWERGTARPRFEFSADVTAEQRDEVQALFESAIDVIAMRFGVHTTDFTVNVDAGNTFYCTVSHDVIEFQFPGCREGAAAHEYFHVLQNVLAVEPDESYFGPDWMSEGTADYAQYVYELETGYRGRNPRFAVEQLTRTPGEVHDFDRRHFWLTYALGFIAAEWLADYAGEESLADFYRLGRIHDRWEDAFRLAFGIEVDDYYEAVELYRHERAPIYPHLTDDRIEPVVVSLSDAASLAAIEIRAEVSEITEFYERRFGGPAAEYTVYVVDAESFPSTFVSVLKVGSGCFIPMVVTHSLTIVLGCEPIHHTFYVPHGSVQKSRLASNHFRSILFDLAPPSSTIPLRTPGANAQCLWGILWLCEGVPEYAAARYDAHIGAADLDAILLGQIRLALNTPKPLSSFEKRYSDRDDPFGNLVSEAALSSVAAHWLADFAGEKALLEYFRLLPSAQTFYEAFEEAFGLTIEEFYKQFEAYRETLTAE